MASPASRFLRKDAPENRAYSITCRDCGQKDTLLPNNPRGTLPPEVVTKKFALRGWDIGSTPRKDVCPECQKAQRGMRYNVDKNLRVDATEMVKPSHLTVVTKEVEVTERKISREDRRIILAKLQEVYQDETTGYRPGWNDDRVAVDLGVFTAWVRDLREQNFGDLPVSAIDKGFLDEAHKLLADIIQVRGDAEAHRNRAKAFLEEAKVGLEALERKLADLLAAEQLLAEQIAKVAA